MKILNVLTVMTFVVVLISCSTYRKPESFEEKMARFKSKSHNENPTPEIVTNSKFNFKKKRGRGPASVDGGISSDRTQIDHSNKKLYFLTLLSQYNQMKKYGRGTAPDISTCPNFHTGLQNHSEKYGKTARNVKKQLAVNFSTDKGIWSDQYVSKYPEMSLPVTYGQAHPTVADILKNNNDKGPLVILQNAWDTHIVKTYKELNQLCNHGISENYYNFENLVSHVKQNNNFKASNKNIKTLLKTPLLSNVALLNSIGKNIKKRSRGRGIASVPINEQYTSEVIRRLNAEWSVQYFQELKK